MNITSTKTQELIFSMLVENTGRHFLDSGDHYGRHWEKNKNKTIQDFIKEPEATLEIDGSDYSGSVSISLFHYLDKALELDEFCEQFNSIPCDNWDSDIYGVSSQGKDYLDGLEATVKGDYNSDNGESALSQVIQYTTLDIDGGEYILIQVHGGCDVRGGYTNAKLFRITDEYLLLETASFVAWSGENRLMVSYNGGSLEVYTEDWKDQSLDLPQALKHFGQGIHPGELF